MAFGAGLYAIGDRTPTRAEDEPVEVEIVPRVAPPPPPPPVLEPAPVVADPAPPALEPPVKPEPPRVARRPARAPTPTPLPAPPAPGPITDDSDPAPSWVMPDQGPGGSIPVARGTPTTRKVGSGGTGKSKGGGGPPTATGQATIRPVSVASIKRRPKPIGDTDFVDARKNYPAEARRLAVEGSIKVRLIVDDKGTVTGRKLIKKLGHGLDELALSLAAKLRFEPAIDTDDKPVAAVVVWTFHFTLPS